MPDPEMRVSGGDIFCLPWMLDAEKMKIEKGYRKRIRKSFIGGENRFVKLRFTYRLAPQVIYR